MRVFLFLVSLGRAFMVYALIKFLRERQYENRDAAMGFLSSNLTFQVQLTLGCFAQERELCNLPPWMREEGGGLRRPSLGSAFSGLSGSSSPNPSAAIELTGIHEQYDSVLLFFCKASCSRNQLHRITIYRILVQTLSTGPVSTPDAQRSLTGLPFKSSCLGPMT